MSKPTNHHYVSRCHQKEFFNDELESIFLYDKKLNRFYKKPSTRRVFSENHLNTRELKSGKIDQESLEFELKVLFEDKFPEHIRRVQEFLNSKINKQDTYESLCWLVMLGILGELRHPNYKKGLDETMLDFESNLILRFYDFDEEVVKGILKKRQQTPYSNTLSYVRIALRILEKMEPFDFSIYSIESDDHFLLPDTSCFQIRGQLQKYPNPYISEIIQIGIPISDKLFVLATPQSLKTEMHGIHFIRENNSGMVFEINRDLFSFAKKAVACKDQDYLKRIVPELKKAVLNNMQNDNTP